MLFSLDCTNWGFDARNSQESAILHINTLLTICSNSIMPQPYMYLSTLFIIVFFFSNMKFIHLLIFINKINIYLLTLFSVFSIGAPQVILLYLNGFTSVQ